jgi:fructose-bisphosphate aldolase/2-amino-3,7-dideoxy-D-threo-hept-6-ulosonate synthase
MMQVGKKLRLGRIFDTESNRTVIVAMDHGLFMGPVRGLENLSTIAKKAVDGGADALMVSPGMVKHVGNEVKGKAGLILRVDGGVTAHGADFFRTRKLASVEDALKLGADAIIAMGYVGTPTESDVLENLGMFSRECEEFGVPLVAEMIPVQGERIKDPYDADVVGLAARIGAETGADVIKTHYTGSEHTFREVVQGCPLPIVVAGGPKMKSEEQLLKMVKGALNAGAVGVAFGRNIWQHRDPAGITRTIVEIVHGKSGTRKVT